MQTTGDCSKLLAAKASITITICHQFVTRSKMLATASKFQEPHISFFPVTSVQLGKQLSSNLHVSSQLFGRTSVCLCLVKSVVNKVLSNFYLYPCCYNVFYRQNNMAHRILLICSSANILVFWLSMCDTFFKFRFSLEI